MTVDQFAVLKQWHVAHRRDHPVEYRVWILMLTIWICGWAGLPAMLVLGSPAGLLGFTLLVIAPSAYVRARLYLHRHSRLRCDWHAAAR